MYANKKCVCIIEAHIKMYTLYYGEVHICVLDPLHDKHQWRPMYGIDYNGVCPVSVMQSIILMENDGHQNWT